MKKVLAMLLALLCLCAGAFAERYESALGYSLDLPEDWLVLSADTYAEIEAAFGAEKMAEIGLSAQTVESMVTLLRNSGVEYLARLDGVGSGSVVVQQQAASKEMLRLSAELLRQGLEEAGVSGAMVGDATFGENEYVALIYETEGTVFASYLYGAGSSFYTFSFEGVQAEVLSPILASAAIAGLEAAGNAPAADAPSGGALLPRRA